VVGDAVLDERARQPGGEPALIGELVEPAMELAIGGLDCQYGLVSGLVYGAAPGLVRISTRTLKGAAPQEERGEYSEFQAAGSTVSGSRSSCEHSRPAQPGSPAQKMVSQQGTAMPWGSDVVRGGCGMGAGRTNTLAGGALARELAVSSCDARAPADWKGSGGGGAAGGEQQQRQHGRHLLRHLPQNTHTRVGGVFVCSFY
jgi:hypothetical protein